MAAEKAFLARRRLIWWYRAVVALVICVFYLVIGRDLLALASAKKDNAKMEIEHEAFQLRQDLKKITGTIDQAGSASAITPETTAAAAQLETLANSNLPTE